MRSRPTTTDVNFPNCLDYLFMNVIITQQSTIDNTRFGEVVSHRQLRFSF